MTRFTHVLALVLSGQLIAQSPGGISSNLRGWYKANSGVTLSSGAVSQWSDNSGLGNNGTQGTSTRRPVPNYTGFNYNTTLTFDGLDDYLNIADLMASTATSLSVFAVARQTAMNRDIYGCIIIGQTNNVGSGGGYGFAANGAGNGGFGLFVREYFSYNANYSNNLAEPTILSGIWNGTSANNIQYFLNGNTMATDPYTPGSVGDNGNSYIGSGIGSGTDYCFYGDIAEIIVYNAGLTAGNADRVESYLAMKYGITKVQDYANSSGSVVFTNSAPYTNDIIAIARDDNSGLYQRQAKTQDDSARIYISTLAANNASNSGTFSGNNQFLVIGSNTGRIMGVTSEKPASLYSRIEREWKVQNTGFTGTWSFDLKLSPGANPGSVFPADLRLLVDADGNFTNATVISSADGLVFTYNDPVITVSGITSAMVPSNSTRYITIGSGSGATTLPVEISGFSAALCESEACLSWTSVTEHNSSRYILERGNAQGEFSEIGVVATKASGGNSREPLQYFFADPEPLYGVSYYALWQIDGDGKKTMYGTRALVNESDNSLEIFPGPSEGQLLVRCGGGCGSHVDLQLCTAEGLQVFKTRIESPDQTFPVSLPPSITRGLYVCKAESAKSQSMSKVLLR